MDFRAIRNANGLSRFVEYVKLSDGLVLADVIKTSDDYIVRVWYSLVPTTIAQLQEWDADFWFVRDNLDTEDWYQYLAVLAKQADNFNDDYLYFY